MVEQDEVHGGVRPRWARATNWRWHKYLNQKKVPQLLISSGASKWQDTEERIP